MKLFKWLLKQQSALVITGVLAAGSAHAGPFILAGTDADDHGSATSTANLDGWLFMQKSLENLAASSELTTTNKVVVSLGSNANTTAGNAAQSAFAKSSLAAAGWTFLQVSDLTSASFDSSIALAGIVMLDSASNVSGGMTSAEDAVLTSKAAAINSFLGGGGALFSQAGAYGWLSALVPGLVVNGVGDQGLNLTAAGKAAFPGLTDADLSAGPYHEYFTNVGLIPVLATGQSGALNVVIGAAGGSITNPIPEPSSIALLALGLVGVGAAVRKRTAA